MKVYVALLSVSSLFTIATGYTSTVKNACSLTMPVSALRSLRSDFDLLTREWYMKPDGQIPAYKWNFSDVNPPVRAWETFRVFKIERRLYGHENVPFRERVFRTLLLNFTWSVNCKEAEGANVFERGFIVLDNIGVFNRSEPLPTRATLCQADDAMTYPDFEDKHSLWNEHDGMYYDAIQ
ncbi:hypothetical protein EDB89DRAFT_2123192 [Lactarius sanguifluus]|nr:hypothetical protein EDB89DRAFT_2123192 [Lactarius sanguifluus]